MAITELQLTQQEANQLILELKELTKKLMEQLKKEQKELYLLNLRMIIENLK